MLFFCPPQCPRPLWLLLLLSLLDIDILNTVVVLWCLSALTHFDSSPFSPPPPPTMSLCCAVVSECMDLHVLHMKGWLWLTLLRRRKEGLGGSASRPTLMVNPVLSLQCSLALVYLCVCVCVCACVFVCVCVCVMNWDCVCVWCHAKKCFQFDVSRVFVYKYEHFRYWVKDMICYISGYIFS